MRLVWMVALKDLRRLRRDPVGLGLALGVPIFVLLLMYALFGRGETRPQGRLLVADEDSSILSRLVVNAFRQEPLAEFVRVEKLPREEARRQVRGGKASALLIIPKGFGGAVLHNEPAQLELVINPAQRILPGMIEEAVSVVTEGAFYLNALAGEDMRELRARSLEDDATIAEPTIAATSVEFYRIGQQLARWLNPPRLELETQVVARGSAVRTSFAAAFIPGMLFLGLLWLTQSLSADLWRERTRGTLRRWLATPRSMASLLAGKLLAAVVVAFAVSLVALACALQIIGLPWKPLVPAALWCTFSAAVFFLLLALAQVYASSERAAQILVNLALFPMILLGGSLFPFEAMPQSLARIGQLTPNGWALTQLRSLLDGAADPARLAWAAALLTALAAGAFLLATRRLRRRFAV